MTHGGICSKPCTGRAPLPLHCWRRRGVGRHVLKEAENPKVQRRLTEYLGEDGDRLPSAAVHRKRYLCVRDTAAAGTSFALRVARGAPETEAAAADRNGPRPESRTSPL